MSIDTENRLVFITLSGEATDEGLVRMREKVVGTPGIDPSFDLVVDVRGARGQALTNGGLDALRHLPLLVGKDSRRAVIVGSDLGYGLARMYASKSGSTIRLIRVFRGPAEARAWIDEDRRR